MLIIADVIISTWLNYPIRLNLINLRNERRLIKNNRVKIGRSAGMETIQATENERSSSKLNVSKYSKWTLCETGRSWNQAVNDLKITGSKVADHLLMVILKSEVKH